MKANAYLIDFTAKDSKKEYLHGYGVNTTIFLTDTIDASDVLKEAQDFYHNNEFDVINAIPVRAHDIRDVVVSARHEYQKMMRKKWGDRIKWFETQYPNGLFTKDDDGNLYGIDIMTKSFIAEFSELAAIESK